MRYFDSGFTAAIQAAREVGIAPLYFAWFTAKDRTTGAPVLMGFWSGDYDFTVNVPLPDGSGTATRTYIGGCGLTVSDLQYVGDLTDNPITVGLSQIADAAQELIRGLDLRLAACETHATSMTGGALVSAPQVQWIGIVDDGPISTPAAGGEGGISLSVRSELMAMLTATNPAKSSDAHQKRRKAGDLFCKFASTIAVRKVQWYKKG
ncbi:hypothetical protein [Paracoccus sp. (in: a-proteobacteria)]|uniref:hypothetical protein n=1 Tax=Paracoccus sp. TaxID=267 RepID=UPI0028970216|nr:hypothetical protein [Paracoccus sp. (in: a-proteobacteria)]